MANTIVAEFASAEALTAACERLWASGYTRIRTWTPYPIHHIQKRAPDSPVGKIMFLAGAIGAAFAYTVQWWCNAHDYPLIVGGRPLNSVPAFIPITFETTVLFAALSGFIATLGLTGLPRLHHPVFAVPGFDRVSVDRFWLGIDATDPRLQDDIADQLSDLGALRCERLEDAA